MVNIFCALYIEAAGIIEKFKLIKQNKNVRLKFDIFENEAHTVRLVLTGIGCINAAMAVSSVCTFYGVSSGDCIINIGTCAGSQSLGTVVVADKVLNQLTGITFYPDMLLKTNLPESAVVTSSKIMSVAEMKDYEVYDMEAAGIYEAAIMFTSPDRISFLKIVSDHGITVTGGISRIKNDVKSIIVSSLPSVFEYINLQLKVISDQSAGSLILEGQELEEFITGLSADLLCTVTMQNRLRQLIRYACLDGIDFEKITAALYDEGLLPVKNKNSGKKVLDELAKRLI